MQWRSSVWRFAISGLVVAAAVAACGCRPTTTTRRLDGVPSPNATVEVAASPTPDAETAPPSRGTAPSASHADHGIVSAAVPTPGGDS